MTREQAMLKQKYGVPEDFEVAVRIAEARLLVSHDEAVAEIRKYREEWLEAGRNSSTGAIHDETAGDVEREARNS